MSNAVSRGPGRGKPNQGFFLDHNVGQTSDQQFVMPYVNPAGPVGHSSYPRYPAQMHPQNYPQYPTQYNQPSIYYPPQPPPALSQQPFGSYPRQGYPPQQMYTSSYQYPVSAQGFRNDAVNYPAQHVTPITQTDSQETKRQRRALDIVDPTTNKVIEVTPRLSNTGVPTVPVAPLAPEEEKKKQVIHRDFLEQVKKGLSSKLESDEDTQDKSAVAQASLLPNFKVPPPVLGTNPTPAAPHITSTEAKTPEVENTDSSSIESESLVTPVSSPQASDTTATTPASGSTESATSGAGARVTPTLSKEESKEETDDDKFEENERDQSPDLVESLPEKSAEELEAENAQKEAEEKEKMRIREETLEKRVESLIASGDADVSNGTFGRDFMITIREIEKIFSRTPCPLTPSQLADFELDIKTMRVTDNKKPNFTPNWAPSKGNRQQRPYCGRTTTDGTGRGAQQPRDRGSHNKRPPPVRASIERVQRITLPSSKDAWKPERQKGAESIPEEEAERKQQEVCKKVRSLMNKVTPTSQLVLTKEFISYNVSSNESQLAQVVEIVFDKAVEEPKFCALYAEICKAQAHHEMAKCNKKSEFRNSVLIRTQMTFHDKNDIDSDKMALIDAEEDPAKRELMLIEEKQKFRRRKFGVMTFIGHLYRNQLLSTKIIQTCTFELFASVLPKSVNGKEPELVIDEESIQCGLQLIETVGSILDKTEDISTAFLDQWLEKLDAAKPYCSNKIRFMIMNLIELRKDNWIPRKSTESGPKKIDEIHKDILQEKIENEKARDQYDRDRERRQGGVRQSSNSLRKSGPTSRNSLERYKGMQQPDQKRAAAAANTKLASANVKPKDISLSAMDNSGLGKNKKGWQSGASGGGTTSESAPPARSAWPRRDSNDQRKKSTVDERQAVVSAVKDHSAMPISARRSASQNSIPDKTDEELSEEEKSARSKIMNAIKSDIGEVVSGDFSPKEMADSFSEYIGKEKYASPSLTVVYEMAIRAVIEKNLNEEERKKLAVILRMSLVGKNEKLAFINGVSRFCKFAVDNELHQDYPYLWVVTGEVLMNTIHVPHELIRTDNLELLTLPDMCPVFLAAKSEGKKKFDLFVQVVKRLAEAEIAEMNSTVGIQWELTDFLQKGDMSKENFLSEMENVKMSNGNALSSLLTKS